MTKTGRHDRRPIINLVALGIGAVALAACSAGTTEVAKTKPTRSKEYFAESEYGVKASPRVSQLASNLPRGGGRDQVGKPYQVRGKWYHPKEDPGYRGSGLASWYGDAFHGRLTANGEVYDMTHLTAAHPTMPLPSYARVTNQKNGSSVIVRVNDRGPFAHGRVIDLSKRAAEVLDYKHSGVAEVTVEYVGRAPLHGQDDQYLVASYRPGNAAPDPSDGMPTGVMIAMNGSTPTPAAPVAASTVPFPGVMTDTGSATIVLPDVVPLAPSRPSVTLASGGPVAVLSYADQRIASASAVESFAMHELDSSKVVAAWDRANPAHAGQDFTYVAAGTFDTKIEAMKIADGLRAFGSVSIDSDGGWYSVAVRPAGDASTDDILQQAWTLGAADAMVIRN